MKCLKDKYKNKEQQFTCNLLFSCFFLTVPVSFVDTAAVQTAKEGDDVTLRCEVKGGVKPIITWTLPEGELLGKFYLNITF